MKKILLFLAATVFATSTFAEGYQVNNMSARQTGMGHVGTAMKLNSESIFFNPAAAAFQKSKFDISVGFTGILSSARFRHIPSLENGYTQGELQKSDNGLSTPIHAYFNYKPSDRWSVGLGFYVPDGSSMKWDDNWTGAHLVQEINLQAFTLQPTVAFKINDKLSIGVGATITWGNFDLRRAVLPVGKGNHVIADALHQIGAGLPGGMGAALAPIENDLRTNYNDVSVASAKLEGDANVAVGINAGIFWDINDRWSMGLTWRSRMNMKVDSGKSHLLLNQGIQNYVNTLDPLVGGKIGQTLAGIQGANFSTELPLPTSVTWGVSFRPNPKWEIGVDIQWVGWSAYKDLSVQFDERMGNKEIYSVKNYANTICYRVGAQYTPNDFLSLRLGAYVDESPVSSSYLNPETPSMAKLTYTAGFSLRPSKRMSIDVAYAYVTSCDPERTGSYPIYGTDPSTGKEVLSDVFMGNYSLHANLFSIGMNFSF